LINRTIVSTDSKCYAKIARSFKAETPVLRPKKLSTDNSRELDFIKHMLKWLKKNENYKPDIVVRLLATCPFQKTKDIDNLIKIVLKKKYDSAAIISSARQHPEKALKIIGKKNK
jgi:CMP-N-acetylneuraminic acid synthetase